MQKRFSLPKVLVVTLIATTGVSGCATGSDSNANSSGSCDAGSVAAGCPCDCGSSCPDGTCQYVEYLDAGLCECLA